HERVHRVGLAPRGARAARAARAYPALCRGQRRAPLRRVVLDLGQLYGQLLLGHRDDAATLAVHDRNRAAPVALARDEPVAQAVVHRGVTLSLAIKPGDDLRDSLAAVQSVEGGRIHERPVAGVGEALL